MARRNRGDEETVSLFPFLSILTCVIGILTMMIAALVLAQVSNSVDPKDAEAVRQADDRQKRYEAARKEVAVKDKQLAVLRKQIAEAEALKKDPARLAKLKQQRAASERDPADIKAAKEILAQVDNLEKKIPEIDADLKLQEQSVMDLTVEIQEKKDPKPVNKIISGGTGKDLIPAFIECETNHVILHTSNPPVKIPRTELAKSDPFKQVVKRVAAQEKATIVFLVRNGGADAFNAARRLADDEGARSGKLPLVGSGEVDLSFFNK
ncbi:MAG: hypothetical protein ACKVJX_01095 [Verrucomicrobiia bacterium]|jgi:hypothetical protein